MLLVSIFLLPVQPSDWFFVAMWCPFFKVLYQAQEQSKHGSEAGGWRILLVCGCGTFPLVPYRLVTHLFARWQPKFKRKNSVVEWVLKKSCRPKLLVICRIIKTKGLTLISYPDSCILGTHTYTHIYTTEWSKSKRKHSESDWQQMQVKKIEKVWFPDKPNPLLRF